MDMDMQQLSEQISFYEQARKSAEIDYYKNPLDADNLTRWGGALLELAQFVNVNESVLMIRDAISKLEEALTVDPKKHDTLWCLGNAHTSIGLLTPDQDDAIASFDEATGYLQKAINEDPDNEAYRKSLEMSSKALAMHAEIHKNSGFAQQTMGSGHSSSSTTKSTNKKKKKKKNYDLTYDICGWVILAVGLVAWMGFAKSQVPPPPSSF